MNTSIGDFYKYRKVASRVFSLTVPSPPSALTESWFITTYSTSWRHHSSAGPFSVRIRSIISCYSSTGLYWSLAGTHPCSHPFPFPPAPPSTATAGHPQLFLFCLPSASCQLPRKSFIRLATTKTSSIVCRIFTFSFFHPLAFVLSSLPFFNHSRHTLSLSFSLDQVYHRPHSF